MSKRSAYQVLRLVISSIAIGLVCSLMILLFKNATEITEHYFFSQARNLKILNFIFPFIGLSLIYVCRSVLFHKNENKGIREITESLKLRDPKVPLYKIPSHLLNGFLTIISGGSTGIEVSSVVASSAIGSLASSKFKIIKKYRSELICAGAAAAITALFNSPFAGIFFAYEVMYKRVSKHFVILTCISVLTSWLFNVVIHQQALFHVEVESWQYHAIPYFILLGVISGLNSVYLTKMVILFKQAFNRIRYKYLSVVSGVIILAVVIYFISGLYGEGYPTIHHFLGNMSQEKIGPVLFLQLLLLVLLKPLVTSVTLASGGDGGVFAPSIFIGATLGLLMALVLNVYFDAGVVPVNFMIVGMASVLCASIQAPLTSVFLVCGITGNYVLIIPLCIGCLMSRITSHFIYPYSVYNYPIKK
jgi:CIC family chloride channel protein